MLLHAILFALLLAPAARPQDAGLQRSIGLELDRISNPQMAWPKRAAAASQLMALSGSRGTQEAVGRLVVRRYLDPRTPDDAVSLLLVVLGRIDTGRRQKLCKQAIDELVDAEVEHQKRDRRRVADTALIRRLDTLLCYCSKDDSQAGMVRINLEVINPATNVLYGGVAGLLFDFTPHPRDRDAAKRLNALMSGSKAEIRKKIRTYICRGKEKELSAGLTKRIEDALASFDEPPDLVKEHDLSLQHLDLFTSCPMLFHQDTSKPWHGVPSADMEVVELRELITGGRMDRHTSHQRALALLVASTRPDADRFLPDFRKALTSRDHPPTWRNVVRDSGDRREEPGVANRLVHLAAARAIVLATWSARAQVRSQHEATRRLAFQYLAGHGTRSEQEFARTHLAAPSRRK